MLGLETILFAFVALFWLAQAVLMARGIPQLPRIADTAPLSDAECPRVSIIFSARDEAEKLPRALETMLALDYPDYEVVAVDDRSRDATPEILDGFAREHSRLKVVHITELPPGWLGKTHGLQRGYEASSGEWLVFTDGDIRFAPELLRRALRIALANQWEHLTLLNPLELVGFWEKVTLGYAWLVGTVAIQPWRVCDPNSKFFAGGGYFQLVRRAAYEQAGTHKKLALEVLDDMKLGKMLKRAGVRSGVGLGAGYVTVRWVAGLGGIIRGVTKNLFAGLHFSLALVLAMTVMLLLLSVLPFVAVFFAEGWTRIFAGAAALVVATIHGVGGAELLKISPLYALTHPLGALLFLYGLLRSTVVTLWQGGVVWRDTFYPLDQLRKGLV